MFSDSTLIYILVGITLAHFILGIGYLLYKLGFSSKPKKEEEVD